MILDARRLIVALAVVFCFTSCSGSTNSGTKNTDTKNTGGKNTRANAKATKTDPSSAKREAAAHHERGAELVGNIYKDLGDVGTNNRAAITEFSEAIRLDPSNAKSFFSRGMCWDRAGEGDKAIADFSEAIRLDPKDASVFNIRGLSWLDKQKYDAAIADLTKAIQLDPSKSFYLRGRAKAWTAMQKYDNAIADLTQAIQLDPRNAPLLGTRASAWKAKKEYQKAIEDYDRALRIASKNTALLHERGWVHETTGKFDKALADYNQAIALNPNGNASLNSKAWIMATCPDERYRNATEALALAKKACELSSWKDYADVDTLAAACAEAGDFESAIKHQQNAIELKRDDPNFVKDANARLALFVAKKPYRTPSNSAEPAQQETAKPAAAKLDTEAVAQILPPKKSKPKTQLVAPEPDKEADNRLRPPGADEIEKSKKLIADLFKVQYSKSKSKPSERAAFAAELLKQAAGTKDDTTARYVLLMEARDIGATAGDAVTAMKAADELVADYQVPPGSLRLNVAEMLLKSNLTQTTGRLAAETLMASAEDVLTLADDEWKTALELFMAAEVAAQKSKSPTLLSTAKNRVKQVEALMAEAKKVEADEVTLQTKPDDQAANLAVGRFLCFYKQDWETGLEMLAKGSDEELNEAAARDKEGNSGDVNQQLAAADTWYDLSEKVEADAKPALKIRAYFWYAKSAGGLSGLNKAKADKRLAELQTLVESRSNKAKLWAGIRKAVADGKTKKWGTVGGAFARKDFDELPPEGAILIGFRYTIQENKCPGSLQPIYLTARGEVMGKVYVSPEKQTAPIIMKGKPGYAVGALYVRGGGGWNGLQVIFMRMTDKGLDVRDRYESVYIGDEGGGEGVLGGDGNFIVGVQGRMSDATKIEALSLFTLTTQPPVPENERPKGRGK